MAAKKRKVVVIISSLAIILTILASIIFVRVHDYFQNPVFKPVLADPSIIKASNGYFYAYGTEDKWDDNKGLKYIPIVRSKNMVDWKYIGDAFAKESRPTWKDGGLWAPDVSYFKSKYYMYYALSVWGDSSPGIGVAVSDSPEGPFTDHGKLFTSNEIGVENSIDPMLFVDKGIPYLFWGSFHGIYGVELSKDRLTIKGKPFQIAGNDFEAPYIYKHNSYYYLFDSNGSCCEGSKSTYNVEVGRSKSLKGPYKDKAGNELLYSRGTIILLGRENSKFVGPGHNAVIKDGNGTDWMVYHAYEKEKPWMKSGAPRRVLMIDPIIWKNGWPSINNMEPGEEKQRVPKVN
ncbi:family 43 glycosylhydrolase [Bacillaceae bacterium C204]|uniref:family 43 glycosylhydrolase n=1 Tax=Neobacillus sp. 204 TaxID=3383351 RepID=UPI003978639F